jgi:AcrR family transcriptional regulator
MSRSIRGATTSRRREGAAAVPARGRKPYHHGDLRSALIEGAAELIAERGERRFSLAQLSRSLGVSAAAPYRHFADRDELLAAVALRALHAFAETLGAESSETDPPEDRLAAMAAAYVRFAAGQPALFGLVFGLGLDTKGRYPELRQAYETVEARLEASVAELCPDDPDAAGALAEAIEATAHGYAALLTDGLEAPATADVDRAASQAAKATRALIQGRTAMRASG